jgi:acetate---CoA ligase (ADP-forming)
VMGRPCFPSLNDVPESVDLVLLGVPDRSLPELVTAAVKRGDGAAVVFGLAHGVGAELATLAVEGGLALCGAGCMGFVNVARGMRAIGYLEREPLVPGPIALVTHSGSVFSAMLRTHRRLEYSLAVSSGQELVTTTADYLGYALELPETRVIGLFLETMRDVPGLRAALERAALDDVAVVALAVGSSPVGRSMVGAHSGALAGESAAWEALFGAYGVHQVRDFDEFVDTLELFAIGRRVRRGTPGQRRRGIATVHDSGGERALVADVAHAVGVPFAEIGEDTSARLAAVLDDGLVPANPLDVWGRGVDTERLFTECLAALAADNAVDLTALAVDLAEEYDGDESYPNAVLRVHEQTAEPVVVLSTIAAAVDQHWAGRLRAAGVPVLEGLSSGLRALGHLRAAAAPTLLPSLAPVDDARRSRWMTRLDVGPPTATELFDLLADYGVDVARPIESGSHDELMRAAAEVGYPLVLKTAAPGLGHKVDVAGVVVGVADQRALASAYAELTARLGPEVVVQPMVPPGVELALGVVRDPHLGPLVLLAAGGTLVELVAQRAVALPPFDAQRAAALLDEVPVIAGLLAGVRGRPAVNRDAVIGALVGVAQLAFELGDRIDALDVNPLICDAKSAVAVDVLLVPAELSGRCGAIAP